MPPLPEQTPKTIGLVEQIADRIVAALREAAAAPQPQTFGPDGTPIYCGISRSAMYRLLAGGQFPSPVRIEGTGPRWRRADLDKWIASLKPSRRKAG